MLAVTSWLALSAEASMHAGQTPAVAEASALRGAALPSGSSDEFRRLMLDWSAPAQGAPLRTTNSRGTEVAARLDRLAISSRFGWRSDPITGVGRRHAGIDLPGRFGAAVMATAPGIVRIAGRAGGYGNLVEIEHSGGVRTRYGHLSRVEVFPSERVEEGQVIGEVGSTGHSTGPHLHYEVRVGGMAVDPLTFVGQRAPSYETTWASELGATPKWAGWAATKGHNLPEASLR